jgi:DNA-binding transcriptional MocR family regulator
MSTNLLRHREVREAIAAHIESGELGAGDRLASEQTLQDEFGSIARALSCSASMHARLAESRATARTTRTLSLHSRAPELISTDSQHSIPYA